MNNYISNIRLKIGSDRFIHPGARIIVENEAKEILVIERADNGKIGLPAGALEEGETIEQCIIREVKEETGIDIIDLVVIGISSNPKIEAVEYPNGDKVQYFTIEFYATLWSGDINVQDEGEVKSAKFVHIDKTKLLPENEYSTFQSLKYFKKHQKILLK